MAPEENISSLQGLRALLYAGARTWFHLFLGSSAVEHSTVNRMVAGSNPARGAICSYSPNIHVHQRHPSLSVLLWVSFGYLGCRTRWRRPAPLFPAGPAIPNRGRRL